MPDQPVETPETPAAESTVETAPAAQTPPWGDDFDASRAWTLVQNLRADKEKQAARLAEYDKAEAAKAEAEKSEIQRATERAERAEKLLADREAAEHRKSILDKHGLSDEDAAFLAGVSEDELETRAQALAKRLGLDKAPAPEVQDKPKPKLTPGHEAAPAPEFDPKAIADRVYSRLR